MNTYLWKLKSPRATFVADMSDEERGLMQQHVAYWQPHLASGTVVALGPVVETGGTNWGLGIMRSESETALRALIDRDPVIAANKNFSYEIAVMPRGVLLGKTTA